MTGLSENINLFDLFSHSAHKFADRPALKAGSENLSYAELNSKALSIAALLDEIAADEQYIGLFCHRSEAAYAGLLGILAAGKTYVPLNPKFPSERNASILEALNIKSIILDQGCASKITELQGSYPALKNIITPGWSMPVTESVSIYEPGEKAFQVKPVSGDTEAYVLFTSGSTGKPKGVPIKHSNVRSYLASLERYVKVKEEDRLSQMFDLTFDLSVHDIFLAFSGGACLCVVPERFVMAPSKFIQDEQVTTWFCVPSVISSLMRLKLLKPDAFPSIKNSFFCGEPLNVQQVAAWRTAASSSKLFNVYGPTEATIAITAYEIPNGNPKNHNGVISLGKVFSEQSYLIDKTETGEQGGELLLGGSQLTEGYLNDEERNRIAFPVINGNRYYRTGDIVFEDADADLFFIGRKDFQVKINGYRVELDEINNLIKEKFGYSLVLSALKQSDEIGGAALETLVTFIEADPSETEKQQQIIETCKQFLPSYMVPKEIRFISSFPRNFNAKVDLKELMKL